jgi:hypothetical protein
LEQVDACSAVERKPVSELADDPEAIGGVVARVVESVRDENADRVIGLLGDHEAAALEERDEVRHERRVIHTNAHAPCIGIESIPANSENDANP